MSDKSYTADDPIKPLRKVSLQLKWLNQFQFAGYYAAKEKGFYEDEGLDVEIRPRKRGINHITEVLEKRADFGVSDSSLILYRLKGSPVVVLAAIYQHSPLVLVTRAEDKIISPLGLKGKRVMMQTGIDAAALTAMFSMMQISLKDIILQPHSLDDSDLITKKTDAISAYITNQPFFYAERGLKTNIIDPSNYGIDFYGDMLFTHEDLIRKDPDLAMRFRRASVKGWDYALKHKDEIANLIYNKYRSDKSLTNLKNEAAATERMVMPNLIEIGQLNPQRFMRIADIYKSEKMAPADSSIDGIDYRKYLPENRKLPEWIWWTVGIAIISTLLILLLIAISWRLHYLVAQRTKELKATTDSFKNYVNIVDRYIITSHTDPQGIITSVSDAYCRVSGFPREEIIGQPHSIFRNPTVPPEFFRDMWDVLKQGGVWNGEMLNRSKTGEDYWIEANIEPLFDCERNISGYLSINIDITDKKKIQEISEHDRLTGLYNRHKLDRLFQVEISRSNRYNNPFSLIIMDIDHFKKVNDTYGHQTGDIILKEFAELIKNNTRLTDMTGRWGGEEFVVICPSTDIEGAKSLAENLRQIVESYKFTTVNHKTASFGISVYNQGDTIDNLIKNADEALYNAKEHGRNQVCTKA